MNKTIIPDIVPDPSDDLDPLPGGGPPPTVPDERR
jgi:hypothetical protein